MKNCEHNSKKVDFLKKKKSRKLLRFQVVWHWWESIDLHKLDLVNKSRLVVEDELSDKRWCWAIRRQWLRQGWLRWARAQKSPKSTAKSVQDGEESSLLLLNVERWFEEHSGSFIASRSVGRLPLVWRPIIPIISRSIGELGRHSWWDFWGNDDKLLINNLREILILDFWY